VRSGALRYHLALLFSALVWGTLHPVGKVLLNAGLTPTQLALIRLVLGALAMFLVLAVFGRLSRLARQPRRELALVAGLGLIGYFTSMRLSLGALTFLPAAMNSLLSNASPLFVVVLTPLMLRQRPSRAALAGVPIGWVGVALLTQSGGGPTGQVPIEGIALALLAALTWSLFIVLARRAMARLDAVQATLVGCAASVPPLLALALAEGGLERLLELSPAVIWGLLWLGLVATGVTFLIWNVALRRMPAASVAAYGYLVPVFALLFAVLLLGEYPSPLFLLGAALVLIGLVAAQRQ
jgi:drug/metabolite transporter (DMT)-like permease